MTYYIYVLRCTDQSLYTGITNDIQKRFEEHRSGKGARYTRMHRPIRIEAVWSCKSRSDALRLEYRIKHLSKKKKEMLIKDVSLLDNFLSDVVQCEIYKPCNFKTNT